ncbi:uncharacterized protein L969DRAFT_96318 [Mixia osmundae IAM 14324]|uniref:JmjC domain-containing protein n=1 Tax=Mixia osmundae (strain CBS 9802 / IAM 14324 / JCM 22182 / KY 12970) TaxID=764103 RepID=G7E532_MIXOS|nr:uncharacterized protein L969DRAFT_96318 [Mixia osmundae IAM 14324]KEI37804.1 hypothetical protein L969DRAFT_96318 [Mixia osmundae IAM 14324]GAA97942.1 hypothetical protein E5Q_04622 [Mixia osmundae IAM 14324]
MPPEDDCPLIYGAKPGYAEFALDCLARNRPAIVKSHHLVSRWPATRRWRCKDGTLNSDTLEQDCGHHSVTVADCSRRDFSDHVRLERTLSEVLTLWREGAGQSLYIKDWHLAQAEDSVAPAQKHSRLSSSFYEVLDLVEDDWLNRYYLSTTKDDFRFVYLGQAGTLTPVHRDVYCSYSWSTNIVGRKRWWLFPPAQAQWLRQGSQTIFDYRAIDPTAFPNAHRLCPYIIEQAPGETIFVPSGWYHQVENLDLCLSINHNWLNSYCLTNVCRAIIDKVEEVQLALADVKDLLETRSGDPNWQLQWHEVVQRLVEQDSGWSWTTFWQMVDHNSSIDVQQDPVSPSLRPADSFVAEQIARCRAMYSTRPESQIIAI